MPDRILIIQLADIGDLVLSTPALAALRAAKPQAHLTLLTSGHAAPIVGETGLVDEIITFDKKIFSGLKALLKPAHLRQILSLHGGHYDTIVFFHHFTLKAGTFKFALMALATGAKRRIGLQNGNGWFLTESIPDAGFGAKHQAQYWLDLVGLLGADSSPRPAKIAITKDDSPSRPIEYPLPMYGEGEGGWGLRIALHAGSGGYSLARRWEPEKFAAVADALHEQFNAQIILVGGAGDDTAQVKAAMKSTVLDFTGRTTLPELASLLKSCALYIGADSGVMHIAAAAGTPVIALFGPSNHEAWSPWNPDGQVVVMRSAPLCSPCGYVDHGIGLRDGCAARTCMRMITPEQVIAAAKMVLNGESESNAESVGATRRVAPTNDHPLSILDIPIDPITYEGWLDLIGGWIAASRSQQRIRHAKQICTVNPEFVIMAQRDVNFRNILRRADVCIPDGVGLLWAARYLGQPLPERVTGSDGVPKIAERAAREGWRLYLLGAAPGIAEKAAKVLQMRYPGLQIAGLYSGSPAPEEEDAIVERVNASDADILFVAYGAPNQDKWIARNLPRLQVSMAMGVGGTFDFIAGIVPRAPLWMQRAGLEWLFRLYLQPRRIGRMMRLPRFVLAVLLRDKR